LVYLYQPERLFFVGDMKQTKTTGSEGTPIDRVFSFDNAHYLRVNFRNPVSVISWAVEKYGYDMVPAGPKYNSDAPMVTYHVDSWEVPEDMKHISPDRALVNIGITEATVRMFQGQTEEELAITATPSSLSTLSVPCIKLVALTRCRGTTHVRLCEDISKDAVMAMIDTREYAKFSPRARREDVKLRDARFMYVIMQHMKHEQAIRVSQAARKELQVEFRRRMKAARSEEEKVEMVKKHDGFYYYFADAVLCAEEAVLNEEQSTCVDSDSTEGSEGVPSEPEIVDDGPSELDLAVAEAKAINKRYWMRKPHPTMWAEVDFEVEQGRPLCADSKAFVERNTVDGVRVQDTSFSAECADTDSDIVTEEESDLFAGLSL